MFKITTTLGICLGAAGCLALAACGTDGSSGSTHIPVSSLTALDVNGDGTVDCIDENGDQECTDEDDPPENELAEGCDAVVTRDADGDGCPESIDVTCDGTPDINVVVVPGCQNGGPADVSVDTDGDGTPDTGKPADVPPTEPPESHDHSGT